jgi:DNA-binding transcriptional ArsR family regulator
MAKRKGTTGGTRSSPEWTVILKALADESRLRIVRELLKHESSVSNLSETLGIRIYNISRHLRVLENSGLVTKRKEGNSRIYSIAKDIKRHFSDEEQILDLGCCMFKFSGSSSD